MELYAPPFEAAASRAAGYMCSCESERRSQAYQPDLDLEVLCSATHEVNGAVSLSLNRQSHQQQVVLREPRDTENDAQGLLQLQWFRCVRVLSALLNTELSIHGVRELSALSSTGSRSSAPSYRAERCACLQF